MSKDSDYFRENKASPPVDQQGALKYSIAVKPAIMSSLTEPVIYHGVEYSNASVTVWKNESYSMLRPLRAALFNGCCCDLELGLHSGQGMDVIFTPSLTAYIVYDIGFYLFLLRSWGSEALCPLFLGTQQVVQHNAQFLWIKLLKQTFTCEMSLMSRWPSWASNLFHPCVFLSMCSRLCCRGSSLNRDAQPSSSQHYF